MAEWQKVPEEENENQSDEDLAEAPPKGGEPVVVPSIAPPNLEWQESDIKVIVRL